MRNKDQTCDRERTPSQNHQRSLDDRFCRRYAGTQTIVPHRSPRHRALETRRRTETRICGLVVLVSEDLEARPLCLQKGNLRHEPRPKLLRPAVARSFDRRIAPTLLHRPYTRHAPCSYSRGTRAVLPTFRVQRRGRMFNLPQTAGFQGFAGASAYCASKFAVEGYSERLAGELNPLGIHVAIVERAYHHPV